MPVVGISIKHLRELIDNKLTNEDIERYCQELGCDVEELTKINRVKCSQCNNITEFTLTENVPNACDICSNEFTADGTDYTTLSPLDVIRLDLLADRPDNFDAGGLARSIRGYLGKQKGLVQYPLGDVEYEVTVDKSVTNKDSYRPYITCAVIKNITINDESLKNLMKLQENLHWALGRDRKHASIGIYDLSNISKKINYTCLANNEIKFVPLGSPNLSDMYLTTPKEVLENHPKGVAYAHLLEGFAKYPFLIDDSGLVLSMPPIINSENTKVNVKTTDVFIDVTGLNTFIIDKILNIIVTSICEWDKNCKPCKVSIQFPDGKTEVKPDLSPADFTLNFDNCRKMIGVDLSDDDIIDKLKCMNYDAEKSGDACSVKIPSYRSDIKHEYDVIEDVAIAYGYKNIEPKMIESFTVGNILPAEKKKQELRELMIGLGFYEILTIMLTSEKRAYEALDMDIPEYCAVIKNPISMDQTIVRTDLVSGLMETIAHNTNNELPQKIFEVGEVIRVNPANRDEVTEQLFFGCGMVNSRIGFADIKSVLQTLMHEHDVAFTLKPLTGPYYLTGRAAAVFVDGKEVGHLGEIHPEILEKYHIYNPVVIFEMNLSAMDIIA